MNSDIIADILDGAADYIEANGLAKNRAFEHNRVVSVRTGGRVTYESPRAACAIGACLASAEASNNQSEWGRAFSALTKSLGFVRVVGWSDDPSREAWEVVEAMRTAAKGVRHGDIT